MQYNKQISYLAPNKLVNGDNINKPLQEISQNVDYLLNFINGNSSILPLIFGNLLDYNSNGSKIFNNGGVFNNHKKCNIWTALSELKIVNDTEINFDQTYNKLVYKGWCDEPLSPNPNWLERVIYIPQYLRNQQLIFSIKCSTSTVNENWSTLNSTTEDIGIEIVGAKEIIQSIYNVGPWEDIEFNQYVDSEYLPKMKTICIPFTVSSDTDTIKIRIFRTTNIGYLHIDKVFVGGLSLPNIDTYNIQNIDINELYDFTNGISKVTSTSVCGHIVPDSIVTDISASNYNNLLTIGQFVETIQNYFSIVNISGRTECTCGVKVYTITHDDFSEFTSPTVNVIIPNITADILIPNLYNVQSDEFTVVLSDIPTITGYAISWSLGGILKNINNNINNLPSTTLSSIPVSSYPNIFDYEETL